MARSEKTTSDAGSSVQHDPISDYSEAKPGELRAMCDLLRGLIDAALPKKATSKVWHGHPVWSIDENPVVGYSATKKSVKLLFWNGQAFDDPALKPVGKYRAAEAEFREASEIDPKVVGRWLKKSKADVFDSQTFFKNLRDARK
jgi:hypothetical protein